MRCSRVVMRGEVLVRKCVMELFTVHRMLMRFARALLNFSLFTKVVACCVIVK